MLTDPHLCADLMRELGARLRWIARAFALDEDEVEDLVQETWAHVYMRREQYRGTGTLRGWVLRACWNVCRQHARASARRRRLLHRAPEDALLSDQPDAPEPVGHPLTRRLRAVWGELPARQQEVLRLHVCQDMPLSVIAGRLHVPLGTVRSDLFRCRRAFRTALKEEHPSSSRR